jgi:hypothetical protein
MRRRVLAVVPLTMLVLGLMALQVGTAFAGGGKSTNGLTVEIECPAATADVGDTLTYTATVTTTHAAVHDLSAVDELSGDAQDGDDPFTQNDTGVFEFTYVVQAGDAGTTLVNSVTATGKEANDAVDGTSDNCETAIAGATTTNTQASTGFSALPYAAAAVLLLGLGGSMVLATKRRSI